MEGLGVGAFKCALHGDHSLLDHALDCWRHFIWQKVGDPDYAAVFCALREYLHRCIVVSKAAALCCPDKPASTFIDINDHLSCDDAIGKRDDSGVAFETTVCHEPRHQQHFGIHAIYGLK